MSYTRNSSKDLHYDTETGQYEPVVSTCTLTINSTPSDAIVILTASGYTQDGNHIVVEKNTVVTYSVSSNDYITQSGTVTVNFDQELNISLNKIQVTLTINSTPSDAIKKLYVDGSSSPVIFNESCNVDINSNITYKVVKNGYVTVTNSLFMDENKEETIELQEGYLVKDLDPVLLFAGNTTIQTIDLNNKPWLDNSISNAFQNCTALTTILNLNYQIVDATAAFHGCTSLVITPDIPNSVLYMDDCYHDCTSLTSITNIPNQVILLNNTFKDCINLVDVSNIEIPVTVTDLNGCFSGCINLTGNIYITSKDIENAENCFLNTTLTKNVYIPFKHADDSYTTTYNSFIDAGYDTQGTLNGVYLKDLALVNLYDEPGIYDIVLDPGTYRLQIHGAGGAGGENGANGYVSSTGALLGNGGKGGAGAKGELLDTTVTLAETTTIALYVGSKGLTKSNGGNGGTGGTGDTFGGAGGNGGGGGEPSYILINNVLYSANGGGGGAGGGGAHCSYDGIGNVYYSGGSGAGGGYYRLVQENSSTYSNITCRNINIYTDIVNNNTIITEVPITENAMLLGTIPSGTEVYNNLVVLDQPMYAAGEPWRDIVWIKSIDITTGSITLEGKWTNGTEVFTKSYGTFTASNSLVLEIINISIQSVPGQNGRDFGSSGSAGISGNTTDFPTLTSGKGGKGRTGTINSKEYPGGAAASGGGASGGGGYTGNENGRCGDGGGGAGGSLDAGGGTGATGGYESGESGSNPHTIPTSTVNCLGDTVTSGWGIGGEVNQNGTNGWIYITKIEES